MSMRKGRARRRAKRREKRGGLSMTDYQKMQDSVRRLGRKYTFELSKPKIRIQVDVEKFERALASAFDELAREASIQLKKMRLKREDL